MFIILPPPLANHVPTRWLKFRREEILVLVVVGHHPILLLEDAILQSMRLMLLIPYVPP